MKYVSTLLLFCLIILNIHAEMNLIEQSKLPRWKSSPNSAGEWKNDSATLKLENSGSNNVMWSILLPEVKKNQEYLFEGEIRSSADWQLYLESGSGSVWESIGLTEIQKPTEDWRKVSFSIVLKVRPVTPGVYIRLRTKGELEARNFKLIPVKGELDALNSGESVEFITPDLLDKWQVKNAPDTLSKDGNILAMTNTQAQKSVYWSFQRIPMLSDVSYKVACKVKATKGVTFRVYIEDNTKGKWQNAGAAPHTATGDWQSISFVSKMQNITGNSYCILMLCGAGEIQFKSFTIAKIVEGVVANANFEQGSNDWEIKKNANVILEPEQKTNNVLELNDNSQVVSSEISVKSMQSYRLSYDVCGIQGYGDSTNAHFFRIYPVTKKGQTLEQNVKWQDCLIGRQKKSIDFKTLPTQKTMRLIIESKAPAKVYIDNIKLTPIAEEIEIAELLLDPPFNFKNGVFASNPSPVITGSVALYGATAKRYNLTLSNNSGNIIWQQESSVGNAFSFATPPSGEKYQLELTVLDQAGKEIFRQQMPIYHYKKNPQEVTFNKDGVMLVNGKRFFHIGHWWTTKRGDLNFEMEFLREAGFNTLLLQGSDAVLDIALKHDMKIIRHLPERISSEQQRQQFIEQLKKNSSHPALLAYFGADEPHWLGTPTEPILDVYKLTSEVDPYHPVWLNEAPRGEIKGLRKYAEAADIYGIDIYPVPEGNSHSELTDKGLTAVGKYTDISHEVVGHRKPIWMILQGFAWAQCHAPDIAAEKSIYPTYEQSRFMAYNAIVHGATGIQYHYLGYTKKVSDKFWKDLRQVTLELEYLSPILVADTVTSATLKCDNDNVRFLQKKYSNQDFYIITNESPDAVTATFTLASATKKLNVLFGEPIYPKQDKFIIELSGRDVKIVSTANFEDKQKIFKPNSYRPYSAPPTEDRATKLLKKANWIWYPDQYKRANSVSFFKRNIELESKPIQALLHIYADDSFGELRINGKLIESEKQLCKSIDVTNQLKEGSNQITLRAADGGVAPCGLLGLLVCKMPNGQVFIVGTDSQWLSSLNGKDGWVNAESIGQFGIMPWGYNNPLLINGNLDN